MTDREKAYKHLIDCEIHPSMQRIAIMQYLMTHHTHPTVDDVYKDLCPQLPTLSRTTVYNTLRMFSEKKAALMLTIDDHRVCYDGNTEPHVHFYCKKCNKVYDMMDEEAPLNITKYIHGNLVEDTQLYYRGICSHCLEAEKQKAS